MIALCTMDADRLTIETLKLLVQVAWADHEIAKEEYDYIMTLAEQSSAAPEVIESLRRALVDEGRIPAPDFGLLRKYPDEVMRAVKDMIAIDNQIVEEEEAIAEQIEELLRG